MQPESAKSVFFHVMILGTILGTCALGVWQLQRRQWKHDMLARLEQSYANPPGVLQPIAHSDVNHLAYSRKMITVDCMPENIQMQPGRYYQGRAGYHVFCTIKNPVGENLLVVLGWRADEDYKSLSKIYFNRAALLLPFAPKPWWLPATTNPHETIWPTQPPAPSYPVYAVVDAQNGTPLPGTDIIPTGERPQLPDDHLQYAITWFALAGVLVALYIYRQWQNQPKTKK